MPRRQSQLQLLLFIIVLKRRVLRHRYRSRISGKREKGHRQWVGGDYDYPIRLSPKNPEERETTDGEELQGNNNIRLDADREREREMGVMEKLRMFVAQEPIVAASCLIGGIGLFLPAVVRPMLDSMQSSEQVPPPALSDVVAGVTGKKA